MKTSTMRIFAVVALMVAALYASPTDARKAVDHSQRNARKSLPLNIKAPTSVDVETRDGKIVAMTAVMKDGSRKNLKAQSKPTCATSCPAGQTLNCWEDEEQMMSICVCGGGGGGGDADWNGVISSADFQF